MFDTLVDFDLRCPYCGESMINHGSEIQTKNLTDTLSHFIVCNHKKKSDCKSSELVGYDHAYVSGKLKYIDAVATCKSSLCRSISRAYQIYALGYTSGFSRWFDVRYPIKNHVVCSPAKIIELDDIKTTPAMVFGECRKHIAATPKLEAKFKKVLKACGDDFALAILMFHC